MPSKTLSRTAGTGQRLLWRIPKCYKPGMRVDGLIFADDALIELIRNDQAPEQVANVAFLPGIQMPAWPCPTSTGATASASAASAPPIRTKGGVISPGGVGYDINCGVRLVRSNLFYRDVKPHLRQLVDELFRQMSRPASARAGQYRFDAQGAAAADGRGRRAIWSTRGLATPSDIEHTEARGCLDGAEPDCVSERAMERGGDQCGTLGSGNHFLEVQVVDADLRRGRPPGAWAWRRTWSA